MTELDNPTAFQRLISEDDAQEMINDLTDLDNPGDVERWEMALSFSKEDIPHLVAELEEIVNDEQ